MIFLRTLDGAVKWALRDLLREALTVVENFIASGSGEVEGHVRSSKASDRL